jgi:hypothetical protein
VATSGLTVPERILVAALALEDAGKTPFTAEDLVVSAWSLYRDTFGLQGYSAQHPDSNRVLTNIMGTKGLRGKGWIIKVGEKKYRLTEAGRRAAKDLSEHATLCAEERAGELSREAIAVLERMALSPPARKLSSGEPVESMTFSDASAFWGISARSSANALRAQFREIEEVLDAAEVVARRGDRVLPTGRRPIRLTKELVQSLRSLYHSMRQRFARELELIEKRRDERRL